MKQLLLILICFFFYNKVFSQKEFQVVKLDSTEVEGMYFIYIKKDSFLKEKFYRISSVKKILLSIL